MDCECGTFDLEKGVMLHFSPLTTVRLLYNGSEWSHGAVLADP